MMNSYRNTLTATCGLLLLLLAPLAPARDDPFNLTEVAQGLYVHHGKHILPTNKDMDIANIGFIVGSRCVAVIDPGGSLKLAGALRRRIRERTELPICYVIDTHVHADHILGAEVFTQDGAEFIGHENLADAILSNESFFEDHFATAREKALGDRLFVLPSRVVKPGQTLRLDLGDRILELRAWPKAHTSTDLTVYDDNTHSFWMGDLLFMRRIPPLEGSLKGWIGVLKELRETVAAKRVIPGHGPVSAAWPSAMDAEQRYLEILLRENRALIAKGGTLEEAMTTVGQSERKNWLLFDDVHKRNVTRAFAELEWE